MYTNRDGNGGGAGSVGCGFRGGAGCVVVDVAGGSGRLVVVSVIAGALVDLPSLPIVINGGVSVLVEILNQLTVTAML